VRASLRDSFPKLFGDRWPEAKRIYVEAFASRHLQTLRAMPQAEELLRTLSQRRLWVGIVSNKTGGFLRKEVEHLGWTGYFRKVIGAGDAPNDKPAIDPVHLALEGSGSPAGNQVWFVGDTEMDMECAHLSGCVPVLLNAEPADPLVYAGRLPLWQGAGCADLARALAALA
jgi:phosphoglycolate phosphatase